MSTRKRKANSLRRSKRKVGKRDDSDSVLSEREETEIAPPRAPLLAHPPTPPPVHPPTPPPVHPPTPPPAHLPTPPPAHSPTPPSAHPPTPPNSPLTKESTPKSHHHHTSHPPSVTPPTLTCNPHFCTPSQFTPLNLTVTYDYHQSFDERDAAAPTKPIEDVIELFRFKDSPKGRLSAVGVWRDLGSSPALETRRSSKTCQPPATCSQLQRLQDLATQLDACVADCKGKLDMDDVANEWESNELSKQGGSPCVKGNSPVIDESSGAPMTLKVKTGESVTSEVVMSEGGRGGEEEEGREEWEDEDCQFWTQAADIVNHLEHSPSTREQFEVASADAFIDQLLSGGDQWETTPRPTRGVCSQGLGRGVCSQGLGSSNSGVKRAVGSDGSGRVSGDHVSTSVVVQAEGCPTVVGGGVMANGVGQGNHSGGRTSGGRVPGSRTVPMESESQPPVSGLNVNCGLRNPATSVQLNSCTTTGYNRPVPTIQGGGTTPPVIGTRSTGTAVSVASGGRLNTRQVGSGQADTRRTNGRKNMCCTTINPVRTNQLAGPSKGYSACGIKSRSTCMNSRCSELERGHLVRASNGPSVAVSASSWPRPPQPIANALISGGGNTTGKPIHTKTNNPVISGAGPHCHGNIVESRRDTMRLKDNARDAKGHPKHPSGFLSVTLPEKLPLVRLVNTNAVSLPNSMPPQTHTSQLGSRHPGVHHGAENCGSLVGKAVPRANCSTYYQGNNQGPRGRAMVLRERKGGSARCSQDEIEKKRQQAKLRLSQRRQNHTLSS